VAECGEHVEEAYHSGLAASTAAAAAAATGGGGGDVPVAAVEDVAVSQLFRCADKRDVLFFAGNLNNTEASPLWAYPSVAVGNVDSALGLGPDYNISVEQEQDLWIAGDSDPGVLLAPESRWGIRHQPLRGGWDDCSRLQRGEKVPPQERLRLMGYSIRSRTYRHVIVIVISVSHHPIHHPIIGFAWLCFRPI
jgi:hypothetical protein